MSQQEARGGGGNLGGSTTGTTCTKTGLYKTTDGKIEFIEYIVAGAAFPNFPGGTGTKKGTWNLVTLASDGNRTSLEAVKVAAGTL
jgi:hypothetical protein